MVSEQYAAETEHEHSWAKLLQTQKTHDHGLTQLILNLRILADLFCVLKSILVFIGRQHLKLISFTKLPIMTGAYREFFPIFIL